MDRITYLNNLIASLPVRIITAEAKGNMAAANAWRAALSSATEELAMRLKIAGA